MTQGAPNVFVLCAVVRCYKVILEFDNPDAENVAALAVDVADVDVADVAQDGNKHP